MNKYGLFVLAFLGFMIISTADNKLKSFCYFTNWSNDISSYEVRFRIQDINTTLCTHLIYAFAQIDFAKVRLIPSAKSDDNGQLYHKAGRYFDFNNLKIEHPHLTTLLSVGGASNGGAGFLQIAQSRGLMVEFSRNCAIYLRDRDFDGIDVDWEYPSDATKDSYTELLKTMREEFEKDAIKRNKPRLLITAAVGVGAKVIEESYNITDISKKSNKKFNQQLSQEWAINKWISEGAPRNKIVMGMTATANTFTLANMSDTGVGALVGAKGKAGPYLQRKGQATYFRVCEMRRNGAVMRWDDEQKMAYAVIDDQWVGYNTPKSMSEKVQFAYNNSLAGTMFWSLDLDDFKGKYCNEDKYPLLSGIYSAILEFEPKTPYTGTPTPAPTTPPTTTPIDFRLHHRTSKDGVNIFNMRDDSNSVTVNIVLFSFVGLVHVISVIL